MRHASISQKIAYDLEYELDDWPVDPHVYQELIGLAEEWQRRARSNDRLFLYYSKAMEYVTIHDGRDPQMPTRQRYDCLRRIIEVCNEAAKNRDQIRAALADAKRERPFSEDDLTEALSILTSRRILCEERGKYFTLAIPEHPTTSEGCNFGAAPPLHR